MKPRIEKYQLDDPELRELVSPELHRWVNSWPSEEQANYGGQYVAVSREKRVVAADKSGARLNRKLEKLGMTRRVLIFYMDPAKWTSLCLTPMLCFFACQ